MTSRLILFEKASVHFEMVNMAYVLVLRSQHWIWVNRVRIGGKDQIHIHPAPPSDILERNRLIRTLASVFFGIALADTLAVPIPIFVWIPYM